MTSLPSARRVLIVDDERDIRTTLHAVFGSAGYECRMAGNGREAARLFEADRAPLTITDLKMPVMDGLQLLQHVKARDADAAVIMLTGAADVRTAVESLKQGVPGPLTPEEWQIMRSHPRSAGSSSTASRSCATRSPSSITTTSAGTAPATPSGSRAGPSRWALASSR